MFQIIEYVAVIRIGVGNRPKLVKRLCTFCGELTENPCDVLASVTSIVFPGLSPLVIALAQHHLPQN